VLTIVGATSGTPAPPAIEPVATARRSTFSSSTRTTAFRGAAATDDDGRRTNAHAVAIAGTFDDCQDLVKALFADVGLRRELNLAAVNSINWARIAAQTCIILLRQQRSARRRGDLVQRADRQFRQCLFGAHRRRMGLPIDRLVIGTNRNDILARFLATGAWRSPRSSRASARAWTSRCRAISSACCSS